MHIAKLPYPLKAFVKRTMPKRLVNAARKAVHEVVWRRQQPAAFDIGNLRSADDFNLDDIRRAAEADYASDNSDIARALTGRSMRTGGDRQGLYQATAYLRPRRVLEIGTYAGESTLYIGAAMRRFSGPGAKLTSVDILDVNSGDGPWRRIGVLAPPSETARRLGLDHFIEFVVSPSEDYLSRCSDTFDLVFLDGDHSPATVYRELAAVLPLLSPSGTVLLHDYFPSGGPLGEVGKVIRGPFVALERIRAEGWALRAMPFGVVGGLRSCLAAVLAE